ncbi:MAG: phosphate signaling complex protein PhoU [Candidatus Omnitrophota bacterium]|nr:phosphate signaling complex protein PhoU [Candidatus Omnitrophota bacterium]
MKRHLDQELKKLKEKLFRMGLLVREAIDEATAALFQRDAEKARQVIKKDQEINLCEIEIDEFGHELIALYQPAAVDLRLITMTLKITNDLERIGDQAVNLAEIALVARAWPLKPYENLVKMAELTVKMMRDALDAFMQQDHRKAKDILEGDDAIDHLNDEVFEQVQNSLEKEPENIRAGVSLMLASHNLERIADLATNIAEDVIYLKRGVDIRHHIRQRRE